MFFFFFQFQKNKINLFYHSEKMEDCSSQPAGEGTMFWWLEQIQTCLAFIISLSMATDQSFFLNQTQILWF